MTEIPTFNLWTEPWIQVERADGAMETVGIEAALTNAGRYRGLYDPSPLVVVAIHRLLVAILQDILRPEKVSQLAGLMGRDEFDADKIAAFGREYAHRFDIFSADEPFMQSADIPLRPEKKGQGKSAGYLFQELTAGTAVTHYNHLYENGLILCATCSAKGVLTVPAFASSGGAGIKPSINGVPPIYVLPGGETYYHSLVASLTTPNFQPEVADRKDDVPWWRREPIVDEKRELTRVGYLYSLTFPARRIRLHPEPMDRPCSRCGRTTGWGVSEMVFKMGESRPKDAPLWRDPFAAYRMRSTGEPPLPVRPVEGRAVWREFGALFLPQQAGGSQYLRPAIIDQIEAVRREFDEADIDQIPFQTVGLRTDMKMKIFEWESNGFPVAPRILNDLEAGDRIIAGLEFAKACEKILNRMYHLYFEGRSPQYPDAAPLKGTDAIRARMIQRYWQRAGDAFRDWLPGFGPQADLDTLFDAWLDDVVGIAGAVFRETAGQLYAGNSTALVCEAAINHCHNSLVSNRYTQYPKEVAL